MRKLFERKARSAGCTEATAFENSGLELVELIFKLLQRCKESRETLLFLGHDRRGSALDKTRIGKFGVGFDDFALDARNIFLQPCSLGGNINLDVQHYTKGMNDCDRGGRRG